MDPWKPRVTTTLFVKTRGIGETLGTARTTGQFGGKSTESSAIPLASSEALSALKSAITGYLQQRRWAYGVYFNWQSKYGNLSKTSLHQAPLSLLLQNAHCFRGQRLVPPSCVFSPCQCFFSAWFPPQGLTSRPSPPGPFSSPYFLVRGFLLSLPGLIFTHLWQASWRSRVSQFSLTVVCSFPVYSSPCQTSIPWMIVLIWNIPSLISFLGWGRGHQ